MDSLTTLCHQPLQHQQVPRAQVRNPPRQLRVRLEASHPVARLDCATWAHLPNGGPTGEQVPALAPDEMQRQIQVLIKVRECD